MLTAFIPFRTDRMNRSRHVVASSSANVGSSSDVNLLSHRTRHICSSFRTRLAKCVDVCSTERTSRQWSRSITALWHSSGRESKVIAPGAPNGDSGLDPMVARGVLAGRAARALEKLNLPRHKNGAKYFLQTSRKMLFRRTPARGRKQRGTRAVMLVFKSRIRLRSRSYPFASSSPRTPPRPLRSPSQRLPE